MLCFHGEILLILYLGFTLPLFFQLVYLLTVFSHPPLQVTTMRENPAVLLSTITQLKLLKGILRNGGYAVNITSKMQ